MNVVEKIKSISYPFHASRNKKYTDDEFIEVSLSWVKGEIAHKQIALGMEINGSNVYNFLARGLRLAYSKGYLKIVEKE